MPRNSNCKGISQLDYRINLFILHLKLVSVSLWFFIADRIRRHADSSSNSRGDTIRQ